MTDSSRGLETVDGRSTVSSRLAEWVSSLDFEDLPGYVVGAAKVHLRDGLGVGLAASVQPGAADLTSAVQRVNGDGGDCTAWTGDRLAMGPAAYVNGTWIHGLEYDDTHVSSVIHGTAVALPAALAAAELHQASGRTLLTAFVVAWEVMVRLGQASPGGYQARGFQTTGACGPFGAAAAAGLIFGLDKHQIDSAFGIAGSSAAGLMQYAVDGADLKRTHPGKAAQDGLLAASAAAAHVHGPAAVIEGDFGLLRTLGGLDETSGAADEITENLGTRWAITDVAVKLHACCHYAHPFLEAMSQILRQGLDPAAIDEVTCEVAPEVVPVICQPLERKQRPASGYEARFSLPFLIALVIADGSVQANSCTDERVSDPRLLTLASRVRFQEDASTGYPQHFGGTVRVRDLSGREWAAHIPDVNGGPERPASSEELAKKFRANAGLALESEGVATLEQAMGAMEEVVNVRELTSILREGLQDC